MTVPELIRLNGIKDPNKLAIGQKLKTKKTASSTSANAKSHKVVSGDTFYRIADKYGLSFAQLKAANPGVNPSRLAIGQVINLTSSAKQSTPPAPVVKQVQQVEKPAPAPAPVSQEAPVKEEPAPLQQQVMDAPTQLVKVVITEPISLANFSSMYGMTPAEVNKLNNWSYDAEQLFDTGSVAFIIKQ